MNSPVGSSKLLPLGAVSWTERPSSEDIIGGLAIGFSLVLEELNCLKSSEVVDRRLRGCGGLDVFKGARARDLLTTPL